MRAAVLGASLAGLFAAAATSSRGVETIILERDRLPAAPEPRKGVPQGRQAHLLLHRGLLSASTLLPGLKPSVVAKTIDVLNQRLLPTGAAVSDHRQVPHDAGALTAALMTEARGDAELIVVFGASAIADRRDVIPVAIEEAGGEVEHFGMPVDPGNLLLIGSLEGKPVIGAPGCARSPKENGFDWVLHRLLADVPVTRADIQGLGVGGLLMEIVSRPQPRAGGTQEDEGDAEEREHRSAGGGEDGLAGILGVGSCGVADGCCELAIGFVDHAVPVHVRAAGVVVRVTRGRSNLVDLDQGRAALDGTVLVARHERAADRGPPAVRVGE